MSVNITILKTDTSPRVEVSKQNGKVIVNSKSVYFYGDYINYIKGAASVTHTKTSIVAGDLLKITEVDDTGGAVGLDIAESIGRHTADYDYDWFALMKIGDVNDITVTFTTGTLLGVPTIKTQYNILMVVKTGANEWTCIGGEA